MNSGDRRLYVKRVAGIAAIFFLVQGTLLLTRSFGESGIGWMAMLGAMAFSLLTPIAVIGAVIWAAWPRLRAIGLPASLAFSLPLLTPHGWVLIGIFSQYLGQYSKWPDRGTLYAASAAIIVAIGVAKRGSFPGAGHHRWPWWLISGSLVVLFAYLLHQTYLSSILNPPPQYGIHTAALLGLWSGAASLAVQGWSGAWLKSRPRPTTSFSALIAAGFIAFVSISAWTSTGTAYVNYELKIAVEVDGQVYEGSSVQQMRAYPRGNSLVKTIIDGDGVLIRLPGDDLVFTLDGTKGSGWAYLNRRVDCQILNPDGPSWLAVRKLQFVRGTCDVPTEQLPLAVQFSSDWQPRIANVNAGKLPGGETVRIVSATVSIEDENPVNTLQNELPFLNVKAGPDTIMTIVKPDGGHLQINHNSFQR